MLRLLKCVRGHQWQADLAATDVPGRPLPACPVCSSTAVPSLPDVTLSPPTDDDEPVAATVLPDDPPPPAKGDGQTLSLPATAPLTAPQVYSSPSPPGGRAAPRTGGVPGYDILGELGRGGMGVVYKARHQKLNRVVALKMILSGEHAGRQELERFRTEGEAVASLRHPGIVQIFEVGEHDGRPFFSLEFVEGGSLSGKIEGTPLPAREAAALVEQIARAMHHAHEKGVVHRDLKPANVLLTAEGQPKVTDFGLAKKLGDSGQTASGAVMGTPSYMAPEQAGGQSKSIGPAADVYALGAILYELLTGRPPFKAATLMDTLMQVVSDEPVPPSRLQTKLPPEVETICLKCLQKDPNRRYATADELAADLKRFLDGEPVLARPVGPWERAVKWVKRRPGIAALLLMLAVTMATGFALVTWKWLEAGKARDDATKEAKEATEARDDAQKASKRADAERARAETQLARAESVIYFNRINLADHELFLGNKDKAEKILDVCQLPLRQWEWRLLRNLLTLTPLDLPAHGAAGTAVAFGPDGQVVTGHADGFIQIHDPAGAPVRAWKAHAAVASVAVNKDGTLVASCGGNDKEVKVWDAKTGELRHTLTGHGAGVAVVRFAPDGQTLASGAYDSLAILWNLRTGERHILGGHALPVVALAFSPDGRRLATASGDKTVKVWDAAAGKLALTFRGHNEIVGSVTFSADGSRVVSGALDVLIWDAESGAVEKTIRGGAYELRLSADGKRLFGVTGDQVKVWDTDSGHEVLTLAAPKDTRFSSLALSGDGRKLAAGFLNGTGRTRVWDASPGAEAFVLHSKFSSVTDVAFSPDGTRLYASSGGLLFLDGAVESWSAATAQEGETFRGHLGGGVTKLAHAPDGKSFASAGNDCTVFLWSPDAVKPLHTLIGHTAPLHALAYSPDGSRLASAGVDRTIRVWDTATGKELRRLPVKAEVFAVAFSPDGASLAAATPEKIHVWDAATGAEKPSLPGRLAVAFSPDGKRLATAGPNHTLKILHAADGRDAVTLTGHTGPVVALAFSPDGRFLASTAGDGTARVWDAESGKERARLLEKSGKVSGAAFSADGRFLAVGNEDRVRVWADTRWTTSR